MKSAVDQIAHALVGDILPELGAELEPPEDTCDRCGRLYLVWPGYSFGLCGVHTVEFQIEITEGEAER